MPRQFKWAFLLLCIAALLLSSACAKEKLPQYYENTYEAGTDVLSVSFAYDTGKVDEDKHPIRHTDEALTEIFSACLTIIDEVTPIFDAADPANALYAVNQQVDAVFDCTGTEMELLSRAYRLCDATHGYFQPVIGSLTLAKPEDIEEALTHTGTEKLTIDGTSVYKNDPVAMADISAMRTGYAMEQIVAYLETTDIVYGVVMLNGNVAVFGEKPEEEAFDIALLADADLDTEEALPEGRLQMREGYLFLTSDATGGTLDVTTGKAAESDIAKVLVLSDDPVEADVLSDALYAMGYDAAQTLYKEGTLRFEAIFFLRNGTVKLTAGAETDAVYTPETTDEKN